MQGRLLTSISDTAFYALSRGAKHFFLRATPKVRNGDILVQSQFDTIRCK